MNIQDIVQNFRTLFSNQQQTAQRVNDLQARIGNLEQGMKAQKLVIDRQSQEINQLKARGGGAPQNLGLVDEDPASEVLGSGLVDGESVHKANGMGEVYLTPEQVAELRGRAAHPVRRA